MLRALSGFGNSMKRILLVDDSKFQRTANMRIVPKAGYDVVAGHREEAMTMVSHDRPDLIALDLLLPKMSGLDVLKGLRQSAGTASIPGDCSERVKRKEWNEAA